MSTFEQRVQAAKAWTEGQRFALIRRLYTPRAIAEQQGTIASDYTVAREAAEGFYARLRELFDAKESITTFGPYSPGQAVTMKRVGIEGIYLGGWATSAKGSLQEDPGPDLASYPLSQVPDEAATLVRALLTADRNQQFYRARMGEEQRKATPEVDYRPFIIADADTGHGGDAHVRNLIRRFVEVGVPGYHIEDQKPGAKKCGHQGGKVLVSSDEQIKRLNAARLQLDIMGVPGILVARTDAEAATLVENNVDERDQPFILGATHLDLPTYKAGYAALQRTLCEQGVEDATGYQLFGLSEREYARASTWLEQAGVLKGVDAVVKTVESGEGGKIEAALDEIEAAFSDAWQQAAGLKTYSEAVADAITFHTQQGEASELSAEEWEEFATTATQFEQRERAKKLGLRITWDDALPKTPDGYYQVRGGIEYAIAKSLAVAPFADILWMETKTADLHDARVFAHAIHAEFPHAMLAYNLSPSFNWDTTGMSEDAMRAFPAELGKLGFVFNFITYGGHQVDGLAGEEFATALEQDGCLALARLQRKLRLIDSPYKTPQSHVGGPRLDAALLSVSGRTAATKAMGKGSTQFQHLVQTEVATKTLDEWVSVWSKEHGIGKLSVALRPQTLGSELLELALRNASGHKILNVVFNHLQDRSGRQILTIRDQNTDPSLRRKRLMTLAQLFLIHRYKAASVHYLTPSDDNQRQALALKELGLFKSVESGSGLVILAEVDTDRVSALVARDGQALKTLVAKKR
jgi:isocitrate lyase